jgi:ABC-type spermidine/putrescine transport system permease subunit II
MYLTLLHSSSSNFMNSFWDAYFLILVELTITLVIGTVLALKYDKYRRPIGKTFVALGIIALIPYIISLISILTANSPSISYGLDNPMLFLFTLGSITLTDGVVNIRQTKSNWIFFLVMAAIILTAIILNIWFFIELY